MCGGFGASVHSRSGVTTGLDGPLVSRSRKATFAPAARPRTPINPNRPRIRRDYPLNLSISVSGGKVTNEDSLSNVTAS
ncbi:hypothetical protein DPMN_176677 [Dreissena polymorpha]|uniref:Uncharacterized protein n=1 Tax=Dreissena polymorpha TaxID=45954 RepID=A0A9D4E8R2_DREPO|nr:hypothetical protein DPMN_176677 [Dreissena polymorpha]